MHNAEKKGDGVGEERTLGGVGDPVAMLEERADLASSLAGQAELSLACSQSADELVQIQMQPQQIHAPALMIEGDTPTKRDDFKNSKECSADDVEVEDRILLPAKTKSELQVGKEAKLNGTILDRTQPKATLQHIDDGSSLAMRLVQSAGGPKSLAGSRSGTVTGAESAAFGGGNVQADQSDHTIGSKSALQGLLPGRVALRGAMGNIAIDFMHDELDGNARSRQLPLAAAKSAEKLAAQHKVHNHDKNKTFLDHDKFERACCPKEGEPPARRAPLSTVNYNQIKFDPKVRERPVDFAQWINTNTAKSVRTSAARRRQAFQHRQFLSRVASNQSKSQALSRHRGFHTNLYRTRDEHYKKYGLVDEDAVSLTAQTNTEEEIINLEAGIVGKLKEQGSKGQGKPVQRPKGGRRLKSANATSHGRKVPKAKYGTRRRKAGVISLHSGENDPAAVPPDDYHEVEAVPGPPAGQWAYPQSLLAPTRTQERMLYAEGPAAISDLASSADGLHPAQHATMTGQQASTSGARSPGSKHQAIPASGPQTAAQLSSVDGRLSSRPAVELHHLDEGRPSPPLEKRGSLPTLEPHLAPGPAHLAAKLAGSAHHLAATNSINTAAVDLADPNDPASPLSQGTDQLQGSKLAPAAVSLESALKIVAEAEKPEKGEEADAKEQLCLPLIAHLRALNGLDLVTLLRRTQQAIQDEEVATAGRDEKKIRRLETVMYGLERVEKESRRSGAQGRPIDGQDAAERSRAGSRRNLAMESRMRQENRYLMSSAQPTVFGLAGHAGRTAVMVTDGSQDYLASQPLPGSHSFLGLPGGLLQADFSRQAAALPRGLHDGTGDRVTYGANGSASSNQNSHVNLANSAGLIDTQDGGFLRSQEAASGASGGTGSQSRLQRSPHRLLKEHSGMVLAQSNQTQKIEPAQSHDHPQDVSSSRKGPISPLRVVVSSTTKVPDLLGNPYRLAQPAKSMLKVQSIINSQGKQADFSRNEQERRSLQHKVSQQRPKRNARLATAKVRGTGHLKPVEAGGPRASHIVMRDYKTGAHVTQEYLDIALLGGEPRSSGAMTSKAATNPAVRLQDTASDTKTGFLGADLSEVDPSRNQTSSQRILGFNIEEEYRLYQLKQQSDEDNRYRYNLDRSYETATRFPETEAVRTPSNVGPGSSCVNIATLAAKGKGKMAIKPAKSETAPAATQPISKNIISPTAMRSQREFVLNTKPAAQSKAGRRPSKSVAKVCQSFAATNMKLHELQNRNRDPSEAELDLSANIAIRQLEGVKVPTHFHQVGGNRMLPQNLRSATEHFSSSPNFVLGANQREAGRRGMSGDEHQVVAKLPSTGEPSDLWGGTRKHPEALQLHHLQQSGSLGLVPRKGSTPATAQLGPGTTFDRSRGSSPTHARSPHRRDSQLSPGTKRRKKSTGQPESPEPFNRTQVEKFSSLEPQACPPAYQRFESFGRSAQEMAQTAYGTGEPEAAINEPQLAVITTPNIIIPQMQLQAGSFILNQTQTDKASDPSSTLKQAILLKQPGGSPALVASGTGGFGLATQSGFAFTQSAFAASQQSFPFADVNNFGRLVPQTIKHREFSQVDDLNRQADTEKTHLVQTSQEDELNRSQQLQGEISLQKRQSINDMTGKTDELKDAFKEAINIQDEVLVEEGRRQSKVPVDVQKMKESKKAEEENEESSSFAEGIQMQQKAINEEMKKSLDSLNDMDPDGEIDSPSPARIPKARYTSIGSIKPEDSTRGADADENKRHSQPIMAEKTAADNRTGRPSVRQQKNNSFGDGSRVEQRRGLVAAGDGSVYQGEPFSPPEGKKSSASGKKLVESKASDEKSQRRYASKSLSSKSAYTRGKKASSPLSALKPFTQLGPTPLSVADSPQQHAFAGLSSQSLIAVVNSRQLPLSDVARAVSGQAFPAGFDKQLYHMEQAQDDELAAVQNQQEAALDAYGGNMVGAGLGDHLGLVGPSHAGVLRGEPGGQNPARRASRQEGRAAYAGDNQLLSLVASLESGATRLGGRPLAQRTGSAGGDRSSRSGSRRPPTAPFHQKWAQTAQIASPADGQDRMMNPKSPKAELPDKTLTFKRTAGLLRPSRSGSRIGSSYRAGSLPRLHSSGKYEEFSVAEMSAQVMLDQADGTTDFSQRNAGRQLVAGSLLSPPRRHMSGNLGATQHHLTTQQNIVTINSVGKTDLNDRESEFEEEALDGGSSRLRRGLHELLVEALQVHESKKQEAIAKYMEKSVANFIAKNQSELSRHLMRNPARTKQYKYYEKQLAANPHMNVERNSKGLRRQDDKDVFLRHIQNDKETQLGRAQFGVQGRRLTSIRQNILQHQICRFIEDQVRILRQAHVRRESFEGRSSFTVDLQGNSMMENLQERYQSYLQVPDFQGQPIINSTRRTVILNQRMQEPAPGETANQVQHLFTALGQGAAEQAETLTGARVEAQTAPQGPAEQTNPPEESRTHHIRVDRPWAARPSQHSVRAHTRMQQEATSRSRASRSRRTSSITQIPRESTHVNKHDYLQSGINTGLIRSSGSREIPHAASTRRNPPDQVTGARVPASPRSKGRRALSRVRREGRGSGGPGADLMGLDLGENRECVQTSGQKSAAVQMTSYGDSAACEDDYGTRQRASGETMLKDLAGLHLPKEAKEEEDDAKDLPHFPQRQPSDVPGAQQSANHASTQRLGATGHRAPPSQPNADGQEHQAGAETVSKEEATRSSREAQLSGAYPNIEKCHLSKTTFSAKLPNQQNPDQIVTLPLHLLSQRDVANPRNPREKNHGQSLSVRNDQDETFAQATAMLRPNAELIDKNMLYQDQEPTQKPPRSRQAHAGATKTSKESLKKMTINESEQQMSNYRITRPVMEGSPMAFAGYGTGNSHELTDKMLLGAMSPPSATSGQQAVPKRPSPARVEVFDSKNNIKKPEELMASLERLGKSHTDSGHKAQAAFRTIGSSKSEVKEGEQASASPPPVDESQQIQARQNLKANEKLQLTVNLADPRQANAEITNVAKQGGPAQLSPREEQRVLKLSRSTLMEKIARSFQTQSSQSRTQAEVREQMAKQKRLQQARKAQAQSHCQAATKAVTEAPGVFDPRASQTNLLMNKSSRLNQRLMQGPGGAARNVIGSLASVHTYVAPGSPNLPSYMPPGILRPPTTQSSIPAHQTQVNYLVKNPTANEMSHSRLIENSRVRRPMPSGHSEPASQQIPKPSRLNTGLPSRVKSAIHRGHVDLSYGVREQRRPAAGLIEYKTAARTQSGCQRSTAKYVLYSKKNFDPYPGAATNPTSASRNPTAAGRRSANSSVAHQMTR